MALLVNPVKELKDQRLLIGHGEKRYEPAEAKTWILLNTSLLGLPETP